MIQQQQMTCEIFYKCSAMLLTAFIKVRVLSDLTEAYNIPNKGKPVDAQAGIMNRKTKGLFMIALAHQNRSKSTIGTIPTLPPIQIPPIFIQPPKVVKFQQEIAQVDTHITTLPWLVDCCILRVIEIPAHQLDNTSSPTSIIKLNNHAKALSYHLISHLPTFL